ncbi:MAG TPA: hypothetical protein VEU62_10425 [Bryobacterales bacterium]|nr:hypothetical protein [Bryobacterales bacterium]
MRALARAAALLAALYLALLAGLLAAMHQPPSRFAGFMAKAQGPWMLAVPFRPLWSMARAGHLRIGDPAPDFDLLALDRQSRVRLASFRGEKPVVLVFGSYT